MKIFKRNKVLIGILMGSCLIGAFRFNIHAKNDIPTIDMGNIHDKSSFKISPWSHDTSLDYPDSSIRGKFTLPVSSVESYADSGTSQSQSNAIYYDNHNTKNFLIFSFFLDNLYIHIACVVSGPGNSFYNRCFKYFLMTDNSEIPDPKSDKWVMVRSEVTDCNYTWLEVSSPANHQIGLLFDNQIKFLYEF